MQQIIDLKAKLAEGESKKYSLLRIATREASPKANADYLGDEFTFNYDIRTSEGKQKLLELVNRLIEEEEAIGEELSEATQDNETAETIHPEAVEINESVKDTFIVRFSEVNDRAEFWGDGKTWQIPKHKQFEPIPNLPTRANCKYARINGHGTYLPPQAIEHQHFTNMDTQSLLELETIEQRLNDLIAEAPNIIFKGRLSTALLQISNTVL